MTAPVGNYSVGISPRSTPTLPEAHTLVLLIVVEHFETKNMRYGT